MGLTTFARAIADGAGRLLWKTQLTLRTTGLQLLSTVRALPETVAEQIRTWRGQTLAMPIDEQRQLLAEFYQKFEDLVELICDAGFDADATPYQVRYQEVRAWLMRAYPLLKPYMSAHLSYDPSDAEFGLSVAGYATDAMEALFCAEQLHTLLEKDEGHLIGRIERARSGLYRYADYLRGIIGT